MRRKVIQHFANMLPQRFLDLPEGIDLAILAKEVNGIVVFDFLQGTASINGIPYPEMRTTANYQAWLLREFESHSIPISAILSASMAVEFMVTEIDIKESFGHVFHSANFSFECASELRTDERSYANRSAGSKVWGYGYYWQKLSDSARSGA